MAELDRIRRTNARTPPPKFIMVGVEVPGGVRLYASRHMPTGLSFGQADFGHDTLWYVEGALSNMLIITKPTWDECLAELFNIWANQDSNERGLPAPAAKPDKRWTPIGNGMAIAPLGTPRPEHLAIEAGPDDEGEAEFVGEFLDEHPDIAAKIIEEGKAALTEPFVLRQPEPPRWCKRQRIGCLNNVTAADWKPFYNDYVCSNCVTLDAADVRKDINPPGDDGIGTLFAKHDPKGDPGPARFAQICRGCGARYGSQEEASLIPEHERTTGISDGELVTGRCEGSGQPPQHAVKILLP